MDDALAGGVSAEDLSLDVITDALREVGDSWAQGDTSVAEEHQASVIATRLVGRLAPHFVRRGRKRGAIVLGTVAGDHHGMPVTLLAGPLRGRGHRVIELGANTPPEAFAETVSRESPVVAVGIFTGFSQEAVVAETVAAVRAVAPDVPIVLGGAGVADREQAEALGGDGFSVDGRAAVALLTDTA